MAVDEGGRAKNPLCGLLDILDGVHRDPDCCAKPGKRNMPAGFRRFEQGFAGLGLGSDMPGPDRAGRSLQRMGKVKTNAARRGHLHLRQNRPGLNDEKGQHLAFEAAIPQGLACEMHKIDRAFEGRRGMIARNATFMDHGLNSQLRA